MELGTIQVESRRVVKALEESGNPLAIRWGFNGVVRGKVLDAYECGVAEVPLAKFFPIDYFQRPEEVHSIDWTMDKERLVTRSADAAQSHISHVLSGANAQEYNVNWGCQYGFFFEEDSGKMEVISQTLLPTLSKMREICAEFKVSSPIGNTCQGEDDSDFGRRESCITCFHKWLKSEACLMYADYVAQNGMRVEEIDINGNLSERIIKPSIDEFDQAHKLALKAFQLGVPTLEKQWNQITAEWDKGARKDISDTEHGYRKDLHQGKPSDKQETFAKNIASSISGARSGESEESLELRRKQLAIEERKLLLEEAKARKEGLLPPLAVDFAMRQAVIVNNKPATIVGKPGGKITVEFEDGTKKTVEKDEVSI